VTTNDVASSPRPRLIDDPIAVDAINDPLRWRIYRQLSTPKTARDLGTILGVRPSRLYYHLALLERRGWIRVVDERRTPGNGMERVYGHADEAAFVLAGSIFEQPGYNEDGWKLGALEEDFAPFEANLDLMLERGYPDDAVIARVLKFRRLSREEAIELMDSVEATINEYFGGSADDDPKACLYGVLFKCEAFVEPPSFLQPTAPAHA
jgi:DNA-binding transcriptional ArsR family regulator